MGSINIKGDGIIIGNANVQNFNKNHSEVNEELLVLISKLANKKERETLEGDLLVVQSTNDGGAKKTAAASRIATFLKTVAGEAGKVLLKKMMESGFDWAEHIGTVANLMPQV